MTTVAVLTATGRGTVTGNLNAGTATPKFVAWGVGTPTATVHDIGMFKEDTGPTRGTGTVTVVTTSTTNDTYQVVSTLTSTGTITVTEVGIFDSATRPFTTTWNSAPTTTSGTSGTTNASYTPANSTYIQTQAGEVMQVVTGSGSTTLTVARGALSSTAATQNSADTIAQGSNPGATVTGGTSFMHASFSGLPLSTGDSIQFTLQTQFS